MTKSGMISRCIILIGLVIGRTLFIPTTALVFERPISTYTTPDHLQHSSVSSSESRHPVGYNLLKRYLEENPVAIKYIPAALGTEVFCERKKYYTNNECFNSFVFFVQSLRGPPRLTS